MRPNLSFDNFVTILAAHRARRTALACGGAEPQPVNATEVKPAASAPATGAASCSAKAAARRPTPRPRAAPPAAACGGVRAARRRHARAAPARSGTPAARGRPPRLPRPLPRPAPAKRRHRGPKKKPSAKPAARRAAARGRARATRRRRFCEPRPGRRPRSALGVPRRASSSRRPRSSAEGAAVCPSISSRSRPRTTCGGGGATPPALAWLAERYPVVTHGLTMSLGGSDPLDEAYLRDLAATHRVRSARRGTRTTCASAPRRPDAPRSLAGGVQGGAASGASPTASRRARDALGVPLAIENVSFYWHPGRAEMGEAEFLARVCEAADCGLMLDVNNAYVNSLNFGFDVDEWMRDRAARAGRADARRGARVVRGRRAGHRRAARAERARAR